MINYTLKCAQGHQFDSWFGSSAAYDALEKAGHLSCAVCGDGTVSKSLMAPRVSVSDAPPVAPDAAESVPAEPVTSVPALSTPDTDMEKAVDALRRKVEATSDYVGEDFVSQARAMHQGDAPERPIYGEARLDQARALAEDGVPVMPLPFRPKQKLT